MNTLVLNAQCSTDATLENEDRLISEAKDVLYARLRKPGQCLESSDSVRDFLILELAELEREVFGCLFLDSRNRLIEYRQLFMGTVDSCSVYPREVLKAALQTNASAIVLAHNHPSGYAEASQADIKVTKDLKSILVELDIRVLDHFIVAGKNTLSFAERGLI